MAGRYIVRSDGQALLIDEHLSERELRFAQRPDGEIDPRFALEAAIDLMSRPFPSTEQVDAPSRSFFTWFHWRRPTPLGGTL
ncbi:hypothetical protein BH23CHL4_BH23CHL4_16370 [soil metagenome]